MGRDQQELALILYDKALSMHMVPGDSMYSYDYTCSVRKDAKASLERLRESRFGRKEFERALNSGPGNLGKFFESAGTYDLTEKIKRMDKLIASTCSWTRE